MLSNIFDFFLIQICILCTPLQISSGIKNPYAKPLLATDFPVAVAHVIFSREVSDNYPVASSKTTSPHDATQGNPMEEISAFCSVLLFSM